MNEEYGKLLEKFKEIAKKRWIKGVNNLTNSVGLTFESQLSKKADNMYFPDYNGIEIKSSQRYSRYPIKLFSISFDGPRLYEMNRILQKYGKNDKTYQERKQLQGKLKINKYEKINNNYFKLKIDKTTEKLILGIYDLNFKMLEEDVYIDFSTIKSRLEIKLTNLAIVYASKKTIDNYLYFRYYLITFYKLRSFEEFIKLLEKNCIEIELVGRVSRRGIEKGRQRNKNIVFSILKENVGLLFQKIIEYNHDTCEK